MNQFFSFREQATPVWFAWKHNMNLKNNLNFLHAFKNYKIVQGQKFICYFDVHQVFLMSFAQFRGGFGSSMQNFNKFCLRKFPTFWGCNK